MVEDSDVVKRNCEAPSGLRATAPLAVIWPLLGRHIAFHRRLVDVTTNVKAALLLSQSIYWTRHGREIAENQGWFWKTAEQWERETGLSAKEQTTARDLLRHLSLVEESRMDIPARLHFRLSLDTLGARLSEQVALRQGERDITDRAILTQLLGPSLAYHRTLAEVTGGIHAGLMLSRALHLTRQQIKRRMDAWICNSAARWSDEIGLTRREQETARRSLTRIGVWEETLKGIPPSMMARIRLDCLLTLLTADASPEILGQGSAPQSSGSRADWAAQNGETRLRQSHIHVSPKAPKLISRNRHHCFDKSAIVLIIRTTKDLLQPQSASQTPDETRLASGGGDLIFPEQLLPDERVAAAQLLRDCQGEAQALLDELAGRLKVRGVRTSPLAYLRALVARAVAGSFVPELGPRIAAQRLQHREEARQRGARAADESRLAAERASSDFEAEVQARRETARREIGDMKRRLRAAQPAAPRSPYPIPDESASQAKE